MSARTSTGRPERPRITIRRAHPFEAPELSGLAERSKRHWGYGDEFIEATRHDIAISSAQITRHACAVAEAGAELVGFYLLDGDELVRMFVSPAFIGQGVGRALMTHMQAVAAARHLDTVKIISDPHAAGFYEGFGAKRIGDHHSGDIPGRILPILELRVVSPYRAD